MAEQKIEYKDLISSFAALKMEKEFANCAESEKNSVHSKLLQKYQEIENLKFQEKYNLDKPYISTHSNPKMEEIREILSVLGIETDIFEIKKNYIDFSLLANRHKIVHGDKTDLDKADFLNTFDIIMELIEKYEDVIIDAIENKKYMK